MVLGNFEKIVTGEVNITVADVFTDVTDSVLNGSVTQFHIVAALKETCRRCDRVGSAFAITYELRTDISTTDDVVDVQHAHGGGIVPRYQWGGMTAAGCSLGLYSFWI